MSAIADYLLVGGDYPAHSVRTTCTREREKIRENARAE